MSRVEDVTAVRVGGWSLIAAAVLFIAVFSYLGAVFDYPDVLDRPAAEVLPRLVALGTTGRAVWSLYALIPLLLVPAGVGTTLALRRESPGAAWTGGAFAVVAAFSMMLGLLRWPSIQWELGRAYATATAAERGSIETVFAGLNSYLGNFIGEFVGEFSLSLYFVLTGWATLHSPQRSRWLGVGGVVAGAAGLVAMFRNVTPAVSLAADANNVVLPLWLVILGVSLARERASD